MTILETVDKCRVAEDCVLDYPFGPDWAVMRHGEGGKVYALVYLREGITRLNLKADPADVVVLSATFASISVGYHMNKRHWLTVTMDGTVPDDLVDRLIAESYRLTLPRANKRDR